jgi:hypothetical protein
MKYTPDTVKRFINALTEGVGRVRACKAAGIDYQTFLNWMEDENKIEFLEAVKKAEAAGLDKIKDMACRGIIEKFQTQWQSAAWWLERNYPEEFRNRQEVSTSGNSTMNVNFVDAGPEISTDEGVER